MAIVSGNCANCGQPLTSEWCAHCGQRLARRLELGALARDSFSNLSELDSTWLRTVVALTLRPGRMVREYLAGRRKPYLAPIKYTFIATTLLVITVNLFDLDVRGPRPMARSADELSALHFVYSVLTYLLFVVLLPTALIQRALFRAAGYNFAETYVFLLYVFGHIQWLTLLFAVTGWMNTWTGLIVALLLQGIYVAWAAAELYASARLSVLLRAGLVALAELVLVNLVAVIVANLFVMLRHP
jgi:hypothetical protein